MARYATIDEVAQMLRCSERTVRRAIAAGSLHAVRIRPRTIRIDLATLGGRSHLFDSVGGLEPEPVG